MTVTNTFPAANGRWMPPTHLLAQKYGPYYLAAERVQAKAYAELVAEYERAGKRGAWKLWQDYVDQWDVRSLEREALNLCFDNALTHAEGEPEYDPAMPDAG